MTQSQDITDILRPAWLATAALIFGRVDSLRPSKPDQRTALPMGELMPRLLAATEPRDMSPEELEAWIEDDSDADVPTFTDPFAFDDPLPGPRSVGVRTRLALLRFCAGIGDITRLAHMAKPGTITVIEGIPAACFESVHKLIVEEIVGLARSLSGVATARKPDEVPKTVVLTPSLSNGDVSQTEITRLDRHFADSLEGTAPILVLLPAGVIPSATLLAAAPLRITLAPLDRSVLLQFFAKTHPTRVKASARVIVARLPPDDLLAGMTDIVVMAALRQGDPRRVADEMTARCARPAGPGLADLPDSPATSAARALVADLHAWRRGEVAWSDIPHSLLLHGPAGTGKSHIAKSMAHEPGLRFVSASFAAWQRCGHLGDMLKAMHASFAEAISLAPCILFLDEIDSAGSRSGGYKSGGSYHRQVVNAFLLSIDELNAAGGVILVGACNDPDALDPAILRPGRLDRKVAVPLPHRAAIVTVLTQGLGSILSRAEIDRLAQRLIGQSMATVDALIRSAKSDARAAGRPLDLAVLEAQMPGCTPNPVVSWRVAVHEAGHAVVAHLLDQGRVTRVSIGQGGGLTERFVDHGESLEEDFENHLAVHLAGRAAERLVLGTISAGSGGPKESDLAIATCLATMIDTQFGLGAYGPVWIHESRHRDPALLGRVRTRLESAEARAAKLIEAHRSSLLAIAEALVAEGELTGDRLDALLAALNTPICSDDPPADPETFPIAC